MATSRKNRSPVISVRLIGAAEEGRWREHLRHLHYLGEDPDIGRTLRYVAHVAGKPDQWLALLAWSEGALRYQARDRWIGWSPLQRRHRRHLVVTNTRFLLLPQPPIAHLGSQVLALTTRQLGRDWRKAHGSCPLLAETFVDVSRFTGAVYRAAGWTPIGETAGFARAQGVRAFHGQRKLALVKPLVECARDHLKAATSEYDRHDCVLLSPIQISELRGVISRIPDRRGRQGRGYVSLHGLWTALIATELSGATATSGLERWLSTVPQHRWTEFGCRRSWNSSTPTLPSAATRRRAMAMFRAAGGYDFLAPWLASIPSRLRTKTAA